MFLYTYKIGTLRRTAFAKLMLHVVQMRDFLKVLESLDRIQTPLQTIPSNDCQLSELLSA